MIRSNRLSKPWSPPPDARRRRSEADQFPTATPVPRSLSSASSRDEQTVTLRTFDRTGAVSVYRPGRRGHCRAPRTRPMYRRGHVGVPLELPRLGRRVHRRPTRGLRVRPCPRQHRPRGNGLPAYRSVRPAAGPDGRLGRVRHLTNSATTDFAPPEPARARVRASPPRPASRRSPPSRTLSCRAINEASRATSTDRPPNATSRERHSCRSRQGSSHSNLGWIHLETAFNVPIDVPTTRTPSR